ncbi:glycoside hydrolase family 31 protein [Penicillium robsamsonii]|uniref:glycoside hydrolase family 31 protein n=1 Tax=Penicillium robsamsonii TaxID=1792511 RepID=UPI00254912D6|nr:glycoside hydrolase family 31 protein [Penicillium robsamsonii]KAJ5816218.1 glycoside hydrolase family 31 protein [Penicillium robsamsonii]
MVRSLILEYPEDRNVWGIESQYFFGSDMLIAPTIQPLDEAEEHMIYLPAGIWFGFWDKKKIVSHGEWIGFDMAPLSRNHIIKDGAMLCWAPARKRTYNEVGIIEKVEIYGQRSGPWVCGDGQGSTVEVIKAENGCSVVGRGGVMVEAFE